MHVWSLARSSWRVTCFQTRWQLRARCRRQSKVDRGARGRAHVLDFVLVRTCPLLHSGADVTRPAMRRQATRAPRGIERLSTHCALSSRRRRRPHQCAPSRHSLANSRGSLPWAHPASWARLPTPAFSARHPPSVGCGFGSRDQMRVHFLPHRRGHPPLPSAWRATAWVRPIARAWEGALGLATARRPWAQEARRTPPPRHWRVANTGE